MESPSSAGRGSSDPVTRRAFLSACSALALSATGCVWSLDNTRLSYLALNEPAPSVYLPVLDALIETILPFDHPRFPAVSAATIERRLVALFPFDGSDTSLSLRKALMIFDDLRLFSMAPAALVAQELDERDLDRSTDHGDLTSRWHDADVRLDVEFRRAVDPHGSSFAGLPPAGRAAYLRMWARSSFSIRRHFYRSSKALVMVTAWSLDAMWAPLGYAGPLLPRA